MQCIPGLVLNVCSPEVRVGPKGLCSLKKPIVFERYILFQTWLRHIVDDTRHSGASCKLTALIPQSSNTIPLLYFKITALHKISENVQGMFNAAPSQIDFQIQEYIYLIMSSALIKNSHKILICCQKLLCQHILHICCLE